MSLRFPSVLETFEKCSILPAQLNSHFIFNRGSSSRKEIGFTFHGAGTNTFNILRINPPKIGGGLKFESDAEIRPKGTFCKGLSYRV
jgi:hypothetical protein